MVAFPLFIVSVDQFENWRQFVKNTLYIIWQSSNETGIPIIDEQHRGIVSAINSLYYFIRHNDAATAFEPTMNVLTYYTSLHFLTEESILREAGYPELNAHIKLHKNLTDQVNSMAQNRANKYQVNALLPFLKEWWLGHINENDRQYIAIVKKHLEFS